MKKVNLLLNLLVLFLLVSSPVYGGDWINPYWTRISSGIQNQVTVFTQKIEKESNVITLKIDTPQIWNYADQEWQSEFNEMLITKTDDFVQNLLSLADGALPTFAPYVGLVDYEVKYNQGGLLSIVLTFYEYTGGAHGMTYKQVLNYDLTTGQEITFADLFPTKTEKMLVIEAINTKIQQNPEWFFISEFEEKMFAEEQSFYLQDGEVVVFFGLYDIAPYASGIQEFVVDVQ